MHITNWWEFHAKGSRFRITLIFIICIVMLVGEVSGITTTINIFDNMIGNNEAYYDGKAWDVDGDGKYDVIAFGYKYDGSTNYGTIGIYEWSGSAFTQQKYFIDNGDTGMYYGGDVFDIDEDSLPEIVVFKRIHPFGTHGSDAGEVVIYDLSTDYNITKKQSSYTDRAGYLMLNPGALKVVDLNGDGNFEIVMAGHASNSSSQKSWNYVQIFEYDGVNLIETAWWSYQWDASDDDRNSEVEVYDMDNDGNLEIITQFGSHIMQSCDGDGGDPATNCTSTAIWRGIAAMFNYDTSGNLDLTDLHTDTYTGSDDGGYQIDHAYGSGLAVRDLNKTDSKIDVLFTGRTRHPCGGSYDSPIVMRSYYDSTRFLDGDEVCTSYGTSAYGHFSQVEVFDFDNDGTEEIMAWGWLNLWSGSFVSGTYLYERDWTPLTSHTYSMASLTSGWDMPQSYGVNLADYDGDLELEYAIVGRGYSGGDWDSLVGLIDEFPNAACKSTETYLTDGIDEDCDGWVDGSLSGDVTPPSVNIISPTDGSTVSGIVDINVDASDSDSSVHWVYFYIDGTFKMLDYTPPYTYSWDTSGEDFQITHNITAIAYDIFGNSAGDSIEVMVDDISNPVVEILLPSEGSVISPNDFGLGYTLLLLVKADDESGINSVRAKIDNGGWNNLALTSSFIYYPKINGTCTAEQKYTDAVYYGWIPANVNEGTYTIYVEAYDSDGNSLIISRDFIYDSTNPVIQEITPTSYSSYTKSGTLPVTVNATDENGICNVKFDVICTDYPNVNYWGAKTAEIDEPPYTLIWDTNEVPDGSFCNIWATAYDNAGMSTSQEWGDPTIYVYIDNGNSPILEIISPQDDYIDRGFTFANNSLNLIVNASDPNGIQNVTYTIDSVNWNEFTLNGDGFYETIIDLSSLLEGYEYLVNIRATDISGYITDKHFHVSIDRTEPIISNVLPLDNSMDWGIATIFAQVYDAVPYNLSFYIDDTYICSQYYDSKNTHGSLTCVYDTNNFENGIHTVKVKALDAAGNSNTTEVSLETINSRITISSVVVGGPYKLYTIDENIVDLSVNVTGEGLFDNEVFLIIEGLPYKYWTFATIPAGETVTIPFTIHLTNFSGGEWVDYGYTPGIQSFTVYAMTNLLEEHDNLSGSFEIKNGPAFEVTNYYTTWTADGDYIVESNEKFNFTFTLKNTGDETADVIKVYNRGVQDNIIIECTHSDINNNFAPDNTWTINYDQLAQYYACMPYGEWDFIGDGTINPKILYEISGTTYESYLKEPFTFSIQSFEKQFYGETNTSQDMEVKAKGVQGDNVLVDLKNIGKVYYVYQYRGWLSSDWEPSYVANEFNWNKILTFLPPGGKKSLNISHAKVGNDYELETRFEYSVFHNEINGLLIAASGIPGWPPVDILMGLLLDAAYESGVPVESITDFTVLTVILEDEQFQDKMIELAGKYGYQMGNEAMEKWVSDFTTGVSFVKAVWGIANWAVDNIQAPVSIYMHTAVQDPPGTYTVAFLDTDDELYFGSLSNESTFGDAYIKMEIYENGEGSYNATFTTRTEYTDFNKDIFNYISKYEVTEEGAIIDNALYGNVTIRIYPLMDTAVNVSTYLINEDFAYYLLQPYFIEIDEVEKSLQNFIEIKGTGTFSSAIAEEEVSSFTRITEEEITSTIYSYGNFAQEENGVLYFNVSFGPRFNVPLDRTNLTVLLPYDNNAITPLPDNITGMTAYWNQTPSNVVIYSGTSTGDAALVSAVTPNSRVAQVGSPITIFASVINYGYGTATDVSISQASSLPATVSYQEWNGIELTGTPDTPATILPGEIKNFVLSITPTSAFSSSDMTFTMASTNGATAPVGIVNTLRLAATTVPSPDVIILGSSTDIPGLTVGTPSVFSLSSANVGNAATSGANLMVDVSTLPITVDQIAEINCSTAAVVGTAINMAIPMDGTNCFGVWFTPTASIANDPAVNRISIALVNGDGIEIGKQSISVSTL